MEKQTLKIGLLGFGAMGKAHAYAVQNLPFYFQSLPFKATIHGVATRSLSRSREICCEHGFALATDNVQDLITSPDIDIIDICTPNHCHADTIRAALANGKHVYCEKPLCGDAKEARELADLARRSGKICTVVFNNRHLAAAVRAKQLIDEGRLGRILAFDFSYLHNSCTDPSRPAGWKQDADICGEGGVLFDLGAHIIDLLYFLCGRVTHVNGRSQIAFANRTGADGKPWQTNSPEAFYMMAKTEGGACGTLTASKLCTGANDDLSFSVWGERGSLRFSLMDPNYLYFYDATAPNAPIGGTSGFTAIECVGRYPAPAGGFPSPKAATGWLRGHVMSMYHFLNAVHTGIQNAPTFADAAHTEAVMAAALASAKSGQETAVEL